jgi:dTDP-glucose 4,6-dehydratase
MRAVVTGGAGFIGSAVCRRLAHTPGWQVLNLDKLTYAANLASLHEVEALPSYRFVHGDICDRALIDNVLGGFKPDIVFHLAAETHVDRSIASSAPFVETNMLGTHVLLEASLAYWDALPNEERNRFRFLHVSTDEVFGSLGVDGLFSEASRYDPHSPYSASKAAADFLVSAWGHTYGLPVLIANCSNNYGPFQFPEKLIPLAILRALEGKPIPVYGDGLNVRDWLYVDDHVEALLLIATKGQLRRSYNVGGRNERTNIEVLRAICALLDEYSPLAGRSHADLITFVPDRPGHDRRYAIDPSRIETELGWRATHTLADGLRKTVRWYVDQADWWKSAGDRRFASEQLIPKAHK